jgi:hypothetical protein
VTRPIAHLDVPLPTLRARIAALVARQGEQRAEESAARLRALPAPTHPDTSKCTPEEGSRE